MILQYENNWVIDFEIGDLTLYTNPCVKVRINDGERWIYKECKIISVDRGQCQFVLNARDLSRIGIYQYQVSILTQDRIITLLNTFEFKVSKQRQLITEMTDVDTPTRDSGDVVSYDSSTRQLISMSNSLTGTTNLNDLSDVDVTTVSEGEFLKYESGLWKNSKVPFLDRSPYIVYFEDWIEGETLEIIDTTPPAEVTNLKAVDIKDTFLTLTWIESISSDIKQYNIYNGSTLLDSVTSTSFRVTGLTQNMNYTFYIKSVDLSDNESAGELITVTTIPSRYSLAMDGLTSSLTFPVMNYDSIKIDIRFKDSYVQPKGGSGLLYSSNYNLHYLTMNGAKGPGTIGLISGTNIIPPNRIPKNSIETVTIKLSSPITKSTGLLTKYDSTPQVKGDLFSIIFYLGESIVAQYDLTTGTVVDQSGNGHDGNLANGNWVNIPY